MLCMAGLQVAGLFADDCWIGSGGRRQHEPANGLKVGQYFGDGRDFWKIGQAFRRSERENLQLAVADEASQTRQRLDDHLNSARKEVAHGLGIAWIRNARDLRAAARA